MLDSRLTRTVALALTATAVAAPTAMARPIESGASAVPVVDAHHQALLHRSDAPSSVVNRDLRMPDTKDAAQGRGLYAQHHTYAYLHPIAPAASRSPQLAATTVARIGRVSDSGMDWGDAAIGAGSAFGITLLAGAGLALGRRRARLSPQAG